MVAALDILVSLLMLGAAVMALTKMLQFVWQVLVVADQTLMVVLVLVVATLVKVVPLAVVRVAAVVKPNLTIMVEMVVVAAQHLKDIAMADQ